MMIQEENERKKKMLKKPSKHIAHTKFYVHSEIRDSINEYRLKG